MYKYISKVGSYINLRLILCYSWCGKLMGWGSWSRLTYRMESYNKPYITNAREISGTYWKWIWKWTGQPHQGSSCRSTRCWKDFIGSGNVHFIMNSWITNIESIKSLSPLTYIKIQYNLEFHIYITSTILYLLIHVMWWKRWWHDKSNFDTECRFIHTLHTQHYFKLINCFSYVHHYIMYDNEKNSQGPFPFMLT